MKLIQKFLPILIIAAIFSYPTFGDQNHQQKTEIAVTIDPRMELLAVVQILSGYDEQTGLITRLDFPYKKDVLEYFGPFKDH